MIYAFYVCVDVAVLVGTYGSSSQQIHCHWYATFFPFVIIECKLII